MADKQTSEESNKYDVGQHVYEHAKKAWGFGKGLPVVSFFLGTTEAVAGKVLEVGAGKKLADVDQEIVKPGFTGLDNMILNPTIKKVLDIVLPVFGKAEDIFKPMVVKAYNVLMKPSVELVLKLAPCGKNEQETKKKTESHEPTSYKEALVQ